MANNTDKTVGELVAEDYRTATVFESFGIDFCCKGNKTLDEVCSSNGIEKEILLGKLKSITNNSFQIGLNYNSWPSDLLADYIEKTHHRYVEEKTLQIKQYLEKICLLHGKQHPELFKVKELFFASADELAVHMKKEELILFPYVRKLLEAKKNGSAVTPPAFGSVNNPVEMMMQDHDAEGDRFREISKLTSNYTPPAEACNTYKVTFSLLQDFEKDLHLHIHLENNILFPKAILLEKAPVATAD